MPIDLAQKFEECENMEFVVPNFNLWSNRRYFTKYPQQQLFNHLTYFHTHNNLIELAQKVKECGNIKNVSNFI
jgi:hypothetical protein